MDENELIEEEEISLEEEEQTGIECIMDQRKVLNAERTYQTYSCYLCPQLKDWICFECMQTCHKSHVGDSKLFSEKTIDITKAYCSCAECGHKVTNQDANIDKTFNRQTSLQCSLNEVLYHSNVDFYYMDPSTQMYYCIFCFLNCFKKKSMSDFIKKERRKFPLGPPACGCTNKKNHATIADNINCLVQLLSDKSFEKYINLNQIPGNIINKNILLEKYLQPLCKVHEQIEKGYNNSTLNYEEYSGLITNLYQNSLKLFGAFSNVFGNYYVIINNPVLTNAFSFEFLMSIFPDVNEGSAKSLRNDSYLIETKTNSLLFFRRFYMEPLTKVYDTFSMNQECENLNPFHRLIMKKDFIEFTDSLRLDKSNFCLLFLHICENILRYNNADEFKIEDEKICDLIIEFFEWCNLLGNLRYTQKEDVNNIYKEIIIGNFNKVVEVARTKSIKVKKMKGLIESFIKATFINLNDEIFYREVLCTEEQKIESQEVETGQNNTILVTNKFDVSSIKHFFSKNNYNSNYNSGFGSSSKEKFIELEEERPETFGNNRDGYSLLNSYLHSKFCFENDSTQKSLLQSLFAFKKNPNDRSPEIQRWEIYDWLISEDDFYMESLKSFLDSEETFTFEIKELMIPISMINTKSYFPNEKMLETLIKNFEAINSLTSQYFEAEIDGTGYIEKIQKSLSETKNLLNSSVGSIIGKTDKKMCQLYLMKRNAFDIILNVYLVFSQNQFLQNLIGLKDIEELHKVIIEIISILINDNALLIGLVFTRGCLDVLFDNPREKASIRAIKENFYMNCLKSALEKGYQLNLTIYVEKMIAIYNEIQNSVNTDVDNILTNSIKEVTSIIKALKKCLKNATKASSNHINCLVRGFIESLFKTNFYQTLWTNYKNSYNNKSMEKLKVKEEEKDFIFSIQKLIQTLNDYNFYIITDIIPKFEIRDLLEENINEMEPDHRRILSMTYSKFYVTSPFNINSSISGSVMDVMIEYPDSNLNGKILLNKEEEEEMKNDENANSSFKRPQSVNPSSNLKKSFSAGKKSGLMKKKEKQNMMVKSIFETSVGASAFIKVINFSETSLGLEPIFTNLSKYKRHMKLYLSTYFKANPPMFIKYFTDVILIPSAFSIYKILYFSSVLNGKYKYLAYKMVYLFLASLKYFIEITLFDPMKFSLNEEYRNMLNDYFIKEKANQEIPDIIRAMKDKLIIDVPKIGKDPKFEPLKTEQLLDYYFKYVKQFKKVSFFPGDKGSGMFLLGRSLSLKLNPNKEEEKDHLNESMQEKNVREFKEKIEEFVEFYSEAKENLDDNIMIDLFSTPTEDDNTRIIDLKNTIILDMLFRLDFSKKQGETYPSGRVFLYHLVNCINKVFKADPDLWHDVIAERSGYTSRVIEDIIKHHLTYLIQFVYIDFHKLTKEEESEETYSIKFFLYLIEFLRLHCENHHKIFQTILTNANITQTDSRGNEDNLDLVNFILKIPVMAMKNVKYFQKKRRYITKFKIPNYNFFNSLVTGVTDYLIEIIQGSFESNMKRFEISSEVGNENEKEDNSNANPDFDSYIETGYYCLDSLDSEESEFFLSQYFRFIICFLEEGLNPALNKEKIVKKFNPKALMNGLAHSTSNLYLFYKEKKLLSNDTVLPEKFADELSDLYLKEEDFQENYYFVLSSSIFRFFKMASQWKEGEEMKRHLVSLKEECDENLPIGNNNKNYIIGRREAYRFYSNIIKEIEIFYRPTETISELERKKYKNFFNTNEEVEKNEKDFKVLSESTGGVQKVVYLIYPESVFLKENDLKKFRAEAPSDENERLDYLLAYVPELDSEIKIRKHLWEKDSKVLSILSHINYKYAVYISMVLSLIINVLLIFSSFYMYTNTNPYQLDFDTKALEGLEEDTADVEVNLIKQRVELNQNHILALSIVQLCFIAIVYGNWLYFILLKLNLTDIKEKKEHFFLTISKLTWESGLTPLGLNFITTIIALISINFNVIFPLQLFSFFQIIESMHIIVNSIMKSYQKFFISCLSIPLLSLFFALVKFALMGNERTFDNFKEYFLSILSDGVIDGNGMEFPIERISDNDYFSEFFFEWCFYLFVSLTTLNVILVHIIDVFQSNLEQNEEENEIKLNQCFICSVNRGVFELKDLDFEEHREKEHNILNYFLYIFKIIFTDEQELNSLDYQVLLSYKENVTDFFPVGEEPTNIGE